MSWNKYSGTRGKDNRVWDYDENLDFKGKIAAEARADKTKVANSKKEVRLKTGDILKYDPKGKNHTMVYVHFKGWRMLYSLTNNKAYPVRGFKPEELYLVNSEKEKIPIPVKVLYAKMYEWMKKEGITNIEDSFTIKED